MNKPQKLNFSYEHLKAFHYIRTFLIAFVLVAVFDFLTDKYVLNRFEPYRILFRATFMAMLLTFLYYRRRKKAESKEAES